MWTSKSCYFVGLKREAKQQLNSTFETLPRYRRLERSPRSCSLLVLSPSFSWASLPPGLCRAVEVMIRRTTLRRWKTCEKNSKPSIGNQLANDLIHWNTRNHGWLWLIRAIYGWWLMIGLGLRIFWASWMKRQAITTAPMNSTTTETMTTTMTTTATVVAWGQRPAVSQRLGLLRWDRKKNTAVLCFP